MKKKFNLIDIPKPSFELTYWPNIKNVLEKYFNGWFDYEPFDNTISSITDVKEKVFEFYEKHKNNYQFDDLLNINPKQSSKSCICCINCYCCYNCLLCENSECCENSFKCSNCKNCNWCKYCQKCKYCAGCDSCDSFKGYVICVL